MSLPIHSFIHSHQAFTSRTSNHAEDILNIESMPGPMETAFQRRDLKKITDISGPIKETT